MYYREIQSAKTKKDFTNQVIALVNNTRLLILKLGTRKLYYLLEQEFKLLNVGRDKLFRILRANNMLIKLKKLYHITTNSHHRFRKHKNQIEELNIKRPNQVRVSGIVYLGNRENPSYLALITDAYSKK